MVMRFPSRILLGVLPALIFLASSCARGEIEVYEKTSQKALPDILEDAEFSITEHNLRIVDRLHIGQAVRARGNQQFPEYEIILYCSLTFAEKILSLSPGIINSCPGRITVRGTKGSYIISAPLWPERSNNADLNRLMQNMNGVVKTIVDYAATDWLATNNN